MNYFTFSTLFCTSSSYICKTAGVKYYQSIFQSFSSCCSGLTIIPFNQALKQDSDVEALVDYIYANLSMDLDYISSHRLAALHLTFHWYPQKQSRN